MDLMSIINGQFFSILDLMEVAAREEELKLKVSIHVHKPLNLYFHRSVIEKSKVNRNECRASQLSREKHRGI